MEYFDVTALVDFEIHLTEIQVSPNEFDKDLIPLCTKCSGNNLIFGDNEANISEQTFTCLCL